MHDHHPGFGRARRAAAATLIGLVAAAGLVACGEEDSSAQNGVDSLTVTGEFGTLPKVEWDGAVEVTGIDKAVLIEGTGPEVAEGSNALARIWIGNGYTTKEATNSFDGPPELLAVGSKTLPTALSESVEGEQVGTRTVVAAPPEDAFGEMGNAQLGIGNFDDVVFIVDIISVVPDGPSGAKQGPQPWMADLTETEDGNVTGMNFSGVPKPTNKLQRGLLVKGTGDVVTDKDTVYVNYLGQVYGGNQPFDESYTKQPIPVDIAQGGVVKGWLQGLPGVPVGSRIMLAIPPQLGYGKQGRPEAGIKADSTMFFVIDVLAKAN